MSSLQDLRDTLDTHAADVHDDVATATRTAAVVTRARAVRRRRAATVAGAAALALAAVLVPTLLPGGQEPVPSDRELIGRQAPETLTSYGYTYRFVRGVESAGDSPARLRLDDVTAPQLVTWASEADDVVVDVDVEGYGGPSAATDFDDFMMVPESARVRLRAGGAPAALAVYELDVDEVPPGITRDGLTFREQVGSERLVDAAVGELGDPEITLEVEVPESERLRVAQFCEGVSLEGDLWVSVSVDGDGALSSSGCDEEPFDPAVGNASWLEPRHLPEPGSTVSIRMWIARGPSGGGDPVVVDGARLAVAAYDVGRPAAVVAGWEMAPLYEHDGHLWSLVTTEEAPRGSGRAAYTNIAEGTRLVVASLSGAGRRTVSFREPRHGGIDRTETGNGSGITGLLRPGDRATLTVQGQPEPTTRLGFAVYERAD